MLWWSLGAHRGGASSEYPRQVLFFVFVFFFRGGGGGGGGKQEKHLPDAHSYLGLLLIKTV